VNETLLPSLSLKKTSISIRQYQRWLWKLGHRCKQHTKVVYWDGRERKDVKKRHKEYLAELEALDPFRAKYAEPDRAEILLELGDEELKHVIIIHAIFMMSPQSIRTSTKITSIGSKQASRS
jgi:hypothetical protein